jgi:type II secretory pathway component PulJ
MQSTYRRTPAGSQAGFSLVELLVSTLIGMVVMGAFMGLSRFQLVTMQDQATQVDLQGTVRGIMQLFERDIRRAGSDPLCTKGFESISSASGWHIFIQSDLDGDGAINGDNEYVGYFYEWGGVYRYSGNQTEVLVNGLDVGGSALRYFDGDGEEIKSDYLDADERASVRRVRIELQLADSSHGSNGSEEITASASSDINLRNRFFLSDTDCETPADDVELSGGEEEEVVVVN